MLDSSYQGVKRLFVLPYDNTAGDNQVSRNSFKKYFLQRVKIENCNIEIDWKKFMNSQLMTWLSNMTKLEKCRQDKMMITRLVVRWILLILKKLQINCC